MNRNAGAVAGNIVHHEKNICGIQLTVVVNIQLFQQSVFQFGIFRKGVVCVTGTVVGAVQHDQVDVCGVHSAVAVGVAYQFWPFFRECGGCCSCCGRGGGVCGCVGGGRTC